MLSTFNTSEELAGSGIDTAVLALGSVEPKGPHLPVGSDLILANRFARDFCSGKAVYLLPVFPFSSGLETRGYRGTVSLRQESLWDALWDIAKVLARQGFRRLVILDFCNYNWIVKQIARELNLNGELIQAVWVNPKEFAKEAADADLLPDYGGGAVETSLALALGGGGVREPLVDHLPEVPREYIDYCGLRRMSPTGLWGKPSKAGLEQGKRFYSIMLEKTAEFVDYALGLFEGSAHAEQAGLALSGQQGAGSSRHAGSGPAGHMERELWWPEGTIPGVLGKGLDWHNTVTEIEQSGADLVVIPTSATEQHSTSQPLATDYLQALELSRRVAGALRGYLLPTLPVVTSWGHIRFRGTVTFGAMTVRKLIEDIVQSLYDGGFRRMVLVNVHGGNWVLKPTLIELNRSHAGLKLISTGDTFAYRGQRPVEHLHADEGEAAFIKAFYPECFREEGVVDYSPLCPAAAFDLVGIGGVSPKGVWGYPSRGTAEMGRTNLDKRVEDAVRYVDRTLSELDAFAG